MVLGSLWNFVKRHRRKVFFAGAVVGGAVLLGKYAQYKFQQYQDKETAEVLAYAKRQHHFDSNQRTCNMTVLSMLPTLREALLQALNTEDITEQLKNKPLNKLELWEELKILSFTRAICAVYCSSMMIVELRVKLNIIGGYMYLDSIQQRNGEVKPVASPEIQHRYLENIHYLLGKGLNDLISVVRPAVEKALEGKSLKQPVTLMDIQSIIHVVRSHVEFRQHNGYHDASPSSLCQFMLAEDAGLDQACSMGADDLMMSRLMRETADMLESSDFHSVLGICLDTSFSRLLDTVAQGFRQNGETQEEFVNPQSRSLPMAKVIPMMASLIYTVCGDAPNVFIQELLLKEQVKDFAANVYEAFSQPDSVMSPA